MAHALTDGGAGRWRDLRTRVLSAAVLAPVALACIWFSRWTFLILAVVGAAGIGWEWAGMCRGRLRWLAAGIPYMGLAIAAAIWLRFDPSAGRANLLFLVLVVWASDIGAYLAGRLIGGARLAPRISPGKTWSGAAGGLAAAVAVGCAAWGAVPVPAPWWRAALVGGGIGLAAQIGDLLESALKRRFGVKDSGRLIPGHGGLLDRLDGFLTAAPVAALLALLLGRGVVLWG